MNIKQRFAVVGAGISGLTIARELSAKGHDVTVIDKARGVGGRMSTRYAAPYQFNHGTPSFTAESDAFIAFLKEWQEKKGVVAYTPKIRRGKNQTVDSKTIHYLGLPKMNGLLKQMSEPLTMHLNTTITSMNRHDQQWQLKTREETSLPNFDWVILSAPAPQCMDLLPETVEFYQTLHSIKTQGCYTLMLGLLPHPDFAWGIWKPKHDVIETITFAPEPETLRIPSNAMVIHSTQRFFEEAFAKGTSDAEIIDKMKAGLASLLPEAFDSIDHCVLHRWRYAHTQPIKHKCLVSQTDQVAVIGDFASPGGVEGAYLSALDCLTTIEIGEIKSTSLRD